MLPKIGVCNFWASSLGFNLQWMLSYSSWVFRQEMYWMRTVICNQPSSETECLVGNLPAGSAYGSNRTEIPCNHRNRSSIDAQEGEVKTPKSNFTFGLVSFCFNQNNLVSYNKNVKVMVIKMWHKRKL